MLNYLRLGQIINTHGVRGEIKVFPLTDNINRFGKLKVVYMKQADEFKAYKVEGVKYLKNLVILKLENINEMNEAVKLIDSYLYIDRENAVKLSKDTYFIADLIGMEVYTLSDEKLGSITMVFPTGSNDVYEIKKDDGKTFLIPAIKDVVKEVDLEKRKMRIELLEGLL
ncbi:MAG: rimM [Clostridiales bacterium]|jgi:16S rRNA processing protein RimM|nr:rimM [Clostridiales bacterium]